MVVCLSAKEHTPPSWYVTLILLPYYLFLALVLIVPFQAGNYVDVPGIFTLEQKRAWVKVTDAVHAKGGYIFCQLWNVRALPPLCKSYRVSILTPQLQVGRTAHPSNLGGRQPFSSSATILEGGTSHFTRDRSGSPTVLPKEMTRQDMKDTIEDYVHAAQTAMEAGFDGVEIHSAVSHDRPLFISMHTS